MNAYLARSQVDQQLGNRQSQACTAVQPRGGSIDLRKRLKELRQTVFADSDAGIDYLHLQIESLPKPLLSVPIFSPFFIIIVFIFIFAVATSIPLLRFFLLLESVLLLPPSAHLARWCAEADDHLSLHGKFDRVVEEIDDDLPQPPCIGTNDTRKAGRKICHARDLYPFPLCDLVEHVKYLIDQVDQIEIRLAQDQLIRFHLREIENIIHYPKQCFTVCVYKEKLSTYWN